MVLITSLVAVIAVARIVSFLIERKIAPSKVTEGLEGMEMLAALKAAVDKHPNAQRFVSLLTFISTGAIALLAWNIMGTGVSGVMLFISWYVIAGGLSWMINGVSSREGSPINTLPGAVLTILVWPFLMVSSLFGAINFTEKAKSEDKG